MNKGQTGEEFVNQIAFSSFLKLWCYPNPLDITGDNKEICDLLIVFNNLCAIISVKNYTFSDNYTRYFRKTTEKAIKQINGAERKLFGSRPILLKHPDRPPIEFQKNKITEVIRIVVNLNPAVQYYQTSFYFKEKHYTIFDAEAWHDAVIELNTLPDFTNYLKERYQLFNKFPAYLLPRDEYDFNSQAKSSLHDEIMSLGKDGHVSLISGTERDLIATYINNGFKFPTELNHDEFNGIIMKIDGEWKKYQASDLKSKKEEVESEGFFVDRLVKEMLLDKTNGEKIARIFYALDRKQRTIFANHYLRFHSDLAKSDESIRWNRTHYSGISTNMVFMYFREEVPLDEIEHFAYLSLIHNNYLHDFKAKEVALIGVSKNFETFVFSYLDGTEQLGEKAIIEAIEIFKKLGWKIK